MPQLHLTEISVRALKGSDQYITYYDSTLPAFGLRCGKRSKTWVVLRGKNRERLTIGRYPDLPLAAARAEAKKLLATEPEPRVPRTAYTAARDDFLEEHYRHSTSAWPAIVKLILNKHFKGFEGKQLADISDADIEDALDRIDGVSARLHAYRVARTFFGWCVKPPRRYLKASPMAGYEPPGKDGKRSRILSDDELIRIWNASEPGSRRVFRLLILWGTRSAETARLERRWVSGDVLTIPGFENGKRVTKNGRAHTVPLLPLAGSVLGAQLETGPYFFPGRFSSDVPIRAGSLAELRRNIQSDSKTSGWGAHDLRRTFRSNMARLRVPRDLGEILLNHAPRTLEEIYDRYEYLDEKREALAKYEGFLLKLLRPGD